MATGKDAFRRAVMKQLAKEVQESLPKEVQDRSVTIRVSPADLGNTFTGESPSFDLERLRRLQEPGKPLTVVVLEEVDSRDQTGQVEPDPVSSGYVAGTGSKVFHRAGCKSAEKIAEKNMVCYASRDAATRAGKRPCARCSP
ncbi:MAG: hypothetical protein HUU20_03245 [Pirellulales bacterium]|nr:hypothetical protein [Pirellulales bacterium]